MNAETTLYVILGGMLVALICVGCYCFYIAKLDADERNEERDLPYEPEGDDAP